VNDSAPTAARPVWKRWLADATATRRLGSALAGDLLVSLREGGSALLLLRGELGAGKTCLVQGLAEGLGISEPITSPTFALAQHYAGRVGERPTALVHLDLYRLDAQAAADELFLQEEEEATALGAVLAVEWPERMGLSPEPAWRLELLVKGEGRWARLDPPPAPRPSVSD
jgi:tRNA threonylcarbamoyladenosine biosynthesis protein TsaE